MNKIYSLKYCHITNTHILRAEGVDKTQPGRELAEQNALAQIPELITQVFNHYLGDAANLLI